MATILWVEDQFHWIDKFKPVLEALDLDGGPNRVLVYKFAEAAAEAIAKMKPEQAPDLAILDAHLNGNDQGGFTVSRALHRKWPELPIIYLSEHSGTGIEQQAFEQDTTQDFIAKHQRNVEAVLSWRVRALVRQKKLKDSPRQDALRSGELTIDLSTWELYWKDNRLMNPTNPKRPLPPTPRKILRFLVEASPRPVSTLQMAERLEADPERFSYASYRQHIKTLRQSLDQAEGGEGSFLQACKQGAGIVTFGDEGAYLWKP